MPKEVQNNIQLCNSYFVNNIKDPYADKVNKKSCLIMHTYINKKKNLVLISSPKIP